MTDTMPTASTIAQSSASAALCPPTRTSRLQFAASRKRSSAGWNRRQTASLIYFDHLVGAPLEMQRHVEVEHIGGLEIDHQSSLVGA